MLNDQQTSRIFSAAMIVAILFCALFTWGIIRAVSWARELPNRITIDEQAMADAFGTAMVQFYHEGLGGQDTATQQQILEQFSDATAQDANAKDWILDEFGDDLENLANSPDEQVATMASALLEEIRDPATN